MDFSSMLYAVGFVSGDTPQIVTSAAETAVDFSELINKFVNMDFLNDFFVKGFPITFAEGFALATLLVLLTFGAFKAFSLIRIKTK